MINDARVRRTYVHLLDALMSLLNEKSFDNISVIEICNRAHIHRATFYKHFTDKYDFLCRCFAMKMDELEFDRSPVITDKQQLNEICSSIFEQLLLFFDENSLLIHSLAGEKYSYSFIAALERSLFDYEVVLLRGIRYPELSEKLIYLCASYYSGALVGLIRNLLEPSFECSYDDLRRFVQIKINDFSNLVFGG